MRKALDNGAFVLHDQPMVNIASSATLCATTARVSTIVSVNACTEAPRGRSRRRVRRPISAVAVAEVHEMRGNGFRKAAPRVVFETTCPAPSLTV